MHLLQFMSFIKFLQRGTNILNSLVIGQKMANPKTGVSRKQSTSNFPKKEHFLPPDTYTYVFLSEDKKCSFFGKFDVLCFLETPVLRFTHLPYYQRIVDSEVVSKGQSKKQLVAVSIP